MGRQSFSPQAMHGGALSKDALASIWRAPLAAGLLQEMFLTLTGKLSQSTVKLRGKSALSLRQMGVTLTSKQTPGGVVEQSQHMGHVAHAQLGVIFPKGAITARVEAMLHLPLFRGSG